VNFRILSWAVVISWNIFNAPQTLATSFYIQPFPETVQEAPVIIRGKAGNSYADWGKDENGTKRIYTYYEIQVSETLKGKVNTQAIVIREVGGEKDGIGLQISGTSHFDKNEDAVIFLREKNSDGVFDVQGMMMGKYNLRTDSEGREYLVGPGLPSEPNSGMTSQKPVQWSLDSLRQLIRQQEGNSSKASSAPLSEKPVSPKVLAPHPSFTLNPSPTSIQAVSKDQSAAPQLQSSATDESSEGNKNWLWMGAGFGIFILSGLLYFTCFRQN
jgi:hypothetical protein